MTMRTNDNGVERDMTEAEQADYKAWAVIAQAEAEARSQAEADKALQRQKVLDKLGLTQDEASALLG